MGICLYQYSYGLSVFANIEKCVELDTVEKESLTGQVRFFLAYSYIRLVALYGDVPLIEKVLTEGEAKVQTRTPKAEVLTFAHGQLDQAIKELEGKTLEKGLLCFTIQQEIQRIHDLNPVDVGIQRLIHRNDDFS